MTVLLVIAILGICATASNNGFTPRSEFCGAWTAGRLQRFINAVLALSKASPLERMQAVLRAAKLAAWPMNETLSAEEQPRLLRIAGDETNKLHLAVIDSPSVHVQFVNSLRCQQGSPLYISSSATSEDLCVHLKEKLDEHWSNTLHTHLAKLMQRPSQLHTFYVGDRAITSTLGDAVSWERAIDDEMPIPIRYERDYAFLRSVEARWPAWEQCGKAVEADAPAEAAAPSAVVAAADAAARVALAAKLLELRSVHAPGDDLKEARCLYAGMLAFAASDADSFELTSAMLCPDGIAPMFATQMLNNIINDLARRPNAPPADKPMNRKAKRDERVVLCSSAEHRIILADCLLDAFWAFTTGTAQAKAARVVFKPVVHRPKRQKGGASSA